MSDYTLPPVPRPLQAAGYLATALSYGHACAEAARAPLLDQLGQCFRLSGADPDGNENWRLAPRAVDSVRQLRADYDEACDEGEKLRARIAELEDQLGITRMCVMCGKSKPASEPREAPGCPPVDPEYGHLCGFDMTPQEAWQHWRKVAHEQRVESDRNRARIAELEAEVSEQDYVIGKTTGLLAETVLILRGPEPPLTKWSYHDIPQLVRALSNDRDRLRAEVETERMRLAACGVIAMANTEDSAAQQRKMLPEYWSGSAESVAAAVDREMALRAEVEAKDAANAALRGFAQKAMEAWPECGLDGFELEDYAKEFGLIQSTRVEGPCGEDCACLAACADWPIDCYHRTALLTGSGPWVNPLAAEVEKYKADAERWKWRKENPTARLVFAGSYCRVENWTEWYQSADAAVDAAIAARKGEGSEG